MSALLARLDADLRDAMRRRDAAALSCLRQVKSRIQEAQNAPDFTPPLDDAKVSAVLAGYIKSLEKATAELASAGPRGEPLVARYANEVVLLRPYLPAQASEGELSGWIAEAIAAVGASTPREAGKVLGAVVKGHPGVVDVPTAKRLIAAALGG